MKLEKRIGLYSVDTTYFYTPEEEYLHNEINELKNYKKKVLKPALKEKQKEIKDHNTAKESDEKYIRFIQAKEELKEKYKLRKEYKELKYHRKNSENRALYDENEREIHKLKAERETLKKYVDNMDFLLMTTTQEYQDMKFINDCINSTKQKLLNEIEKNVPITRRLSKMPFLKDKIANFDNSLLRAIGAKPDTFTEDIITIRVYYYGILKSILLNGFMLRNDKYVFWSASAGQIRTKKCVFIKESTLNKYYNTIHCGLTLDKINKPRIKIKDGKEIVEIGCNKNKYLAYTSLAATGSDKWEDFNIDQCIVVDDFETVVHGVVDYIDYNKYDKDNLWTIERKEMDITIPTMDGCGISMDYTGMFRAPWCKGLFAQVPFHTFIREKRKETGDKTIGIVKDIYGDEHDILKENIRHIMTKSQFKMYQM